MNIVLLSSTIGLEKTSPPDSEKPGFEQVVEGLEKFVYGDGGLKNIIKPHDLINVVLVDNPRDNLGSLASGIVYFPRQKATTLFGHRTRRGLRGRTYVWLCGVEGAFNQLEKPVDYVFFYPADVTWHSLDKN